MIWSKEKKLPFTAQNFPGRSHRWIDRKWGDEVLRQNEIPLTMQGVDACISILTGKQTFEAIREDMVSLNLPEDTGDRWKRPIKSQNPERFQRSALEHILGSLQLNGLVIQTTRRGVTRYDMTPLGLETLDDAKAVFAGFRTISSISCPNSSFA
jgi:hypothetical protein